MFAGVGGFRVGFERASSRFKTVWNNQWEPSTKRQDASIIYQHRFGPEGHCNKDISKVLASEIPDSDMLCGGFPCQDYSVATTLVNSKGIEGKRVFCGGRFKESCVIKQKKRQSICSWKMWTAYLVRLPSNEAGISPLFWLHCLTLVIMWNGELLMQLTMVCHNVESEPTLLHITNPAV